MTAIFQNRTVSLCENSFSENFCQYETAWFEGIWTFKNADKKNITFSWRRKTYKSGLKADAVCM